MARFTLTIDTDNTTFDDMTELPMLIKATATRVYGLSSRTNASGLVRDSNGNTVGEWSIKADA